MNAKNLIKRQLDAELDGIERQGQEAKGQPELLRVAEAAQLLALSRTKVYEMAERSEIPVLKIGTAVRIPRRKLLGWIEAQTAGADDLERGR